MLAIYGTLHGSEEPAGLSCYWNKAGLGIRILRGFGV